MVMVVMTIMMSPVVGIGGAEQRGREKEAGKDDTNAVAGIGKTLFLLILGPFLIFSLNFHKGRT